MPFNYELAKEIHKNKYCYDKVRFKNVDTKVEIHCPVHGYFYQTPYHHINRKQGCGLCKGNRISKTKRLSFDDFIKKAVDTHGNKYDYSKAVYESSHKHVIIICPKHGEFKQSPNNHIYNTCGCPNCGYNSSSTGKAWLDSLNIPEINREVVIFINNKKYKVDALLDNVIYEYFGFFWHGHPDFFNREDVNPKNKKTYGELYDSTLQRIEEFNKSYYDFIYVWGK